MTLERRAGRFIALAEPEALLKLTYPIAPRQDVVDDLHGQPLADPVGLGADILAFFTEMIARGSGVSPEKGRYAP